LDLDLYTNAPAESVGWHDHIVLHNGEHVVDEVRLFGRDTVEFVALYSRLVGAEPDSKRTVTEYRATDRVQVVPDGPDAVGVWETLREAVAMGHERWLDKHTDDTTSAVPAAPWDVIDGVVRLSSGGRIWTLAPRVEPTTVTFDNTVVYPEDPEA